MCAQWVLAAQVSDANFEKGIHLMASEKDWSGEDYFVRKEKLQSNQFLLEHRATFGAYLYDESKIITLSLLTVVTNHGEYYSMNSRIPLYIDSLYQEITVPGGYFDKGARKSLSKADSVSYKQGEHGDLELAIKQSYKGDKPYKIMQSLNHNFNKIHKTYTYLAGAELKAAKKKRKAFEKSKLTSVNTDSFSHLINDGSWNEAFKKEGGKGALGYWSYYSNNLELNFDLYNLKDRFVIYITGNVEKENIASYKPVFEQYAAKKKFKNASLTELGIPPDETGYIGIKATFLYDGSLTGKDFVEGINSYYKYAKKMNKAY